MNTCVYGIVADSHPLDLGGLRGIGDPATEIRVVEDAGLAAVVSTASEPVRAKRRDIVAHQTLLDRLGAQDTVLPMRFGMLAPSDGAVTEELRAGAEHYRSLLAALRGRVEVNVKAEHSEEAVLREVLRQNGALRSARERLNEMGGGDLRERIAFGESAAKAVEQWSRRDADRIAADLGEHAEQVSFGPLVNGCSVNVSLLVERDRVSAVAQEVDRLRSTTVTLTNIRLHGPLSPYSFVTARRLAAE